MTGKQAIIQLKVKINQLDTASNRTVRSEQALLFLNDAYLKLAKAKYRNTNQQEDTTGFQLNQVTTDELNHLTKVQELVPNQEGDEYNISISDIDNYWIHLRSELKIKVGTKEKWIKNPNYTSLDVLGPSASDPFNETIPSSPIIFFENDKIKVLVKDFEVKTHKIVYYSKPVVIANDEEIKAPFADEIVDMAAVMLLENWGDQRATSLLSLNRIVENE